MEINWKVGGITAAAAFVISIFSAGISGVSFGLLLLRAIISAVVFGALGTGVYLLIKQQLPELFGAAPADTGEKDKDIGSNVDIVLDDDISNAEVVGAGTEDDDSDIPEAEAVNEDEQDVNDRESHPPAGAAAESEHDEAPADGGFDAEADSEEISELEAAEAEEDTEEDSLVEEVEEVEENGVEEDSADNTAASGSGIDPAVDVDRLPDLENFSDTFVNTDTPEDSSGGTTMDSLESNENDGQDPAVIARAVRTVLKRDQ